eukprot:746214-Hanusia_phi.AAC.5
MRGFSTFVATGAYPYPTKMMTTCTQITPTLLRSQRCWKLHFQADVEGGGVGGGGRRGVEEERGGL